MTGVIASRVQAEFTTGEPSPAATTQPPRVPVWEWQAGTRFVGLLGPLGVPVLVPMPPDDTPAPCAGCGDSLNVRVLLFLEPDGLICCGCFEKRHATDGGDRCACGAPVLITEDGTPLAPDLSAIHDCPLAIHDIYRFAHQWRDERAQRRRVV